MGGKKDLRVPLCIEPASPNDFENYFYVSLQRWLKKMISCYSPSFPALNYLSASASRRVDLFDSVVKKNTVLERFAVQTDDLEVSFFSNKTHGN